MSGSTVLVWSAKYGKNACYWNQQQAFLLYLALQTESRKFMNWGEETLEETSTRWLGNN